MVEYPLPTLIYSFIMILHSSPKMKFYFKFSGKCLFVFHLQTNLCEEDLKTVTVATMKEQLKKKQPQNKQSNKDSVIKISRHGR